MALLSLLLTFLSLIFVILVWVSRVLGRPVIPKPGGTNPPPRCACGYPLENLDVPRCPECGRIVGFHATAEDLGLSYEQLQRVQAAQQHRRQQAAGQ